MAKKVMYVGGVGLSRGRGLPLCGLRDFIGHKVMLMEVRDAIELLNGTDFIEVDAKVPHDYDYTVEKAAETQAILETFKADLDAAALNQVETKLTQREERKISKSREKNEEDTA
jgi:hypothetical protein